jgi:hypothetical protein
LPPQKMAVAESEYAPQGTTQLPPQKMMASPPQIPSQSRSEQEMYWKLSHQSGKAVLEHQRVSH